MSTALGTAQDFPVGPGPHPGHMLAMSVLGVFLEMLSPSQSGQLLLCLQPLACHFKEEPSPNLGRGVKMFCESTAGFHDAVSSSLHSPAFSTAVADSSPASCSHPVCLFFSVWGGVGAVAGDWGLPMSVSLLSSSGMSLRCVYSVPQTLLRLSPNCPQQ